MGDDPPDKSREDSELTRVTMSVGGGSARPRSKVAIHPCLVILSGPNVGEVYQLNAPEFIVGRGASASIRIPDDSVSRKHARVRVEGEAVMIDDLGSANGTLVNGELITRRILREGDKIQLSGDVVLKFTSDAIEESFQRQMYDAALRDGLTHAYNRKYLLDRMSTEVAYAHRHDTPLSLVIFDADHFKRVNDTHGHLAGDAVLVKLVQLAAASIRSEDVLARYGGEEFAIVCRGIACDGALTLAERLRELVASTSFEYGNIRMSVTISVGVAGTPRLPMTNAADLIAAADAALYEAKNAGRNRVVAG